MKVIDLLNRIANGEEVPKKIKYDEHIWLFKEGVREYLEEYDLYKLDNFEFSELNEEVEIIEDKPFNERVEEIYNRHIDYIYGKEDKKINKIKQLNNVASCKELIELEDKQQINNHILKDKINEIIDYLEEK